MLALILMMILPTGAALAVAGTLQDDILIATNNQVNLLNDEADILTSGEEANVLAKLQEVSDKYDFDVAVLTVNSTGGKNIQAFADDYWDYNGFGRGVSHDGILLVLDMGERDWYLCTTGRGYDVFNDTDIQNMGKAFVNKLSDGDFEGAFLEYADQCDAYLEWAEAGFPDDGDPAVQKRRIITPGKIFVWIAGSLGLGAITGTRAKKSAERELRTVHRKSDARNYQTQAGVQMTNSNDLFLYSNTVVTVLPPPDTNRSDNSHHSSGHTGGSIHMGSSGTFHGGGGGKF